MIKEIVRRPVAAYAAVFSLTAAVFGWIQAQPSFRDPDSFYHAKMAELVLRGGAVKSFPWLPFTTLGADYADHHFLYHLILAPFVALAGPLLGTKIATVALSAAAVTAFFAFLRDRGVRYAGVYAALLATTSGFVFRVNLAKATALSLIFLFTALIFMRRGSRWPLFFLAWLYVWAYAGWPILLAFVLASVAARIVFDAAGSTHPAHSWASIWYWRRVFSGSRHALRELRLSNEVRNLFSVTAGLVAGLVCNPFFPANLRFYWEQIVQVAVVGYGTVIGVGSEWYPYKFGELFGEAGGVFILLAVALLCVLLAMLWDDVESLRPMGRAEAESIAQAFLIGAAFFFLTLRSRRHIEYFVPFGMAFGALTMHAVTSRMDLAKLRQRLEHVLGHRLFVATAATIVFFLGFLGMRTVNGVHASFNRGFDWNRYGGAAAWLSSNVPEGSVVFHSDWDEFPLLFLKDDRARYIAGLDPTFLYRQDPLKYRQWVDITTGKRKTAVAATISRAFGSRYVFIDRKHTAMYGVVDADPAMHLVYKDDDAWIYSVSR